MHDNTIKPSILIVDDVPGNLDVLKDALEDEYIVRAAMNGPLALRLAAMEPRPDLILLDIVMPGMDGYEVCRQLKEDNRTQGIPVIFVTAKSDGKDELEGLQVGAVDYLTKPISPLIVKARVRLHLAWGVQIGQNHVPGKRTRKHAKIVLFNNTLQRFL